MSMVEAARRAGLAVSTACRWLKHGAVPSAQKVGGRWKLDEAAVAELRHLADARKAVSGSART